MHRDLNPNLFGGPSGGTAGVGGAGGASGAGAGAGMGAGYGASSAAGSAIGAGYGASSAAGSAMGAGYGASGAAGSALGANTIAAPRTSVMGTPSSALGEESRRVPYPPVDLKAMELAIASLKGAMIQMERRTETIAFKMEELARTVHARLERFSQSIVRAEDTLNKSQQENAQRFATVVQKVNERKINDGKVAELVDRHNMVVRNFENRLASLQRLVNEQEMALHNAQAAMIEATNEIARLKRT